MNIKKTELDKFEVAADTVSLWIVIEHSRPYYFVEYNGEMIGLRDESFTKTTSIYRNIRKVVRLQNEKTVTEDS